MCHSMLPECESNIHGHKYYTSGISIQSKLVHPKAVHHCEEKEDKGS